MNLIDSIRKYREEYEEDQVSCHIDWDDMSGILDALEIAINELKRGGNDEAVRKIEEILSLEAL